MGQFAGLDESRNQPAANDDAARLRYPITVIMNSGSGADEKEEIRRRIVEVLSGSGHAFSIVEAKPKGDFRALCEHEVIEAGKNGGVVAAAGGDGTINAVAGACCRHGVPLGVIPLGTFNYFSRELGIPGTPEAAAGTLISGQLRRISIGWVNDRLFLNNASFGTYTRIIRRREEDKSRYGRFRLVALLSGIVTLFRQQKPFAIKISADGIEQVRRTAMVFVGNNTVQLANLDMELAQCAKEDRLAVIIVKPMSRAAMAGLLMRGVLKGLNRDSRLEMFCADSFEVDSKRKAVNVVVDGEVIRCQAPLKFRIGRAELQVICPKPDTDG